MADASAAAAATAAEATTMVAKYGKQKIELSDLHSTTTTIGHVKDLLREKTGILPMRQKLIGLKMTTKGQELTDSTLLSELKQAKRNNDGNMVQVHQFILMGTPEEQIFVDPSEKDDLPDVLDDFELDFNAGSEEWVNHKAKEDNLQKFTESTAVHIINPPRKIISSGQYKPLLVLDLDHTLLDFSRSHLQENSHSAAAIGGADDSVANVLKRPYMDEFLTWTYKHYDLVVWSQTSWRWLEVKLTELGMLTHPGYKFCFVLDKTSMFQIVSTNRSGKKVTHHVKPLQIIWSKFQHWGPHNTVHLDDLKRNFALNIGNGLKCSACYRKKKKKKSSGKNDSELLGLGRFLELLATHNEAEHDFESVQFDYWQDYVSGKLAFGKKK